MDILLAASRSLNSANSLLSCCYDRWLWLQCLHPQQNNSPFETEGLQELLGRRRRQRRQRSQNMSTATSENTQASPRNETTSSTSSVVAATYEDGSETSSSLAMDNTIEKWRQNAEDALSEATRRSRAGGFSPPRSPVQSNLQDAYQTRAHPANRESGSFKDRDAAQITRGYGSLDAAFVEASLAPYPRDSIRRSNPSYTRPTTNTYGYFPQESGHQGGSPGSTRTTLHSTLHNSFDKEAIDYVPYYPGRCPPNSPPLSESRSARSHQASLSTPQTSWPSSGPGPTQPAVDNGAVNLKPPYPTLSANASRTSLHSAVSQETHVPRSRGRRWLEEQSDRLAAGY